MSTAILHFGMHKSGSTAIQESLFSTSGSGFDYLNFGHPNASGAVKTIFRNNAVLDGELRKPGVRPSDLIDQRRQQLASLRRQLEQPSHDLLVLSAESIGGLKEDELGALRDEIAPHVDQIHAVGYIRPPIAYAASVFQQNVKFGYTKNLNFAMLMPHYARRFEKFDRVFGAENVTFRLYDPQNFLDGDVVKDFYQLIGIDSARQLPSEENSSNVSLAQQAVAFLFACNTHGNFSKDYKASMRRRRELVAFLSELSGPKLGFSGQQFHKALDRIEADIQWIEQRMRASFPTEELGGTHTITCEDDLFDYQRWAFEWLLDQANLETFEEISWPPSPSEIASLLGTL